MAQLDAIRHEIRTLSMLNRGPMTKNLMEKTLDSSREPDATSEVSEKLEEDKSLPKVPHPDLTNTVTSNLSSTLFLFIHFCCLLYGVLGLNHQLQPILSAKQQLMQNSQKLLPRQGRILKVNLINNMMTLAFYPCFQPQQKVLVCYQNIKLLFQYSRNWFASIGASSSRVELKMTSNAEISTGLEEIKQMLLGMQQRNKEFWDEQVIQIRSLRHTFNQTAAELSRLQTFMAEPTQEIENAGCVETPHDKAKEDDYDAPAEKEAADEDGKVVVEPAAPVMAVFKVLLILPYNCSIVEKITEYVELHQPPLVHGLRAPGNYCMPSVCGNVTVKCHAYSVSSLHQRTRQSPLCKLSVQDLLVWVAKPPPLPPEITLHVTYMVLGAPFSSRLKLRLLDKSVYRTVEFLIIEDVSMVAEEKFEGLTVTPSTTIVKVPCRRQYDFLLIDEIADCIEVCPLPSNYSEKTLENFCTSGVCINASMNKSSQLAASLSLSCTSHNFAGLKCVDSIHHGLDKPPPLPPEITYGFASNNLGLLINLMLGSFKNQKLAHDLGTSYLKAKDAQVDEFLLYENTNSDMNKQYYLTLMSDCLAGIVILFEKCKILEVKPSNLSQSQFVHQIINEPMKVVCTDSLGGSIQLEFFLFSALKPPEFTVLQLNLSFFFVGFQSADLIHIELHKPPPLPPDPEYAYGFDTVLWQAVISTNILFEVTVEESSDLIELTNPEQQLSSSKLIVEFDALIGRRGKRLLVGQNFDIYQLTEFVKTGFGGEVGLKLGCVVDGHLKVNDKRQKKKGIGGSTVDSQCFLKSAAPEINGWKNFTRSGWPGVSDNLQRLTGWENRRLQLPNYTFLNRYRALDAVQQPLKNRWLDQLVEVGYYDVGRVRRPLAQMQDQTHSGFFMSISQVEHHLTYGNSRYESSMNNMIVKDKITGVVSQFYVNATGAVSQSYVNAIVATVKIKCTIQCVGWSFIGFVIVKLLTLRTRSFSKRRGMLQEGISSYLRIVRVK